VISKHHFESPVRYIRTLISA